MRTVRHVTFTFLLHALTIEEAKGVGQNGHAERRTGIPSASASASHPIGNEVDTRNQSNFLLGGQKPTHSSKRRPTLGISPKWVNRLFFC